MLAVDAASRCSSAAQQVLACRTPPKQMLDAYPHAWFLSRCVFPAADTPSACVSSFTSAQSQPAEDAGSKLTKTAGRASHRLQVQSAPTTAQAAPSGHEESQKAGAVGPGPALQISDAMTDTARVEEAPLLRYSEAIAHTKAGVCDRMVCCDVTACEHTVEGASEPQPNSTVKLPAARSRLLGLRMSWLQKQAGHQSEQVSYQYIICCCSFCIRLACVCVCAALRRFLYAVQRKLIPGKAGCPYAHTILGYRFA